MLHQINICKNDYETAFLKNLKLSFTDSGGNMKILVLNGSPKKKNDTFRLTDAFLVCEQ